MEPIEVKKTAYSLGQNDSLGRKLELSRQLFIAAFFMLITGFLFGVYNDLRAGVWVVLINDSLSLLVFIVGLILFSRKKLRQGGALVFCLSEAIRNFYVSFIIMRSLAPDQVDLPAMMMQCLFVTGLFASVLGLAVHKNIALACSLLGVVVQLIYVALSPDEPIIRELFMLNSFILTGNLILIYYYRSMLERLVKQLSESLNIAGQLKDKAEAIAEINRPFVSFGKNTAGLVHDFRNDVNTLFITVQTMQLNHNKGKLPYEDEIVRIERSLANLSRRIDWVTYVTDAGEAPSAEWLDMQELVESAIYPFMISPELRGKITFNVNIDSKTLVWGSRRQYLHIVDNIIRNSCEALSENALQSSIPVPVGVHEKYLDLSTHLGTVSVVVQHDDREVRIAFTDDGPGIPFCADCEKRDCLNCDCFKIGRTTKVHGSGFGMVNVIQTIRSMKGNLKIQTAMGKGTVIKIGLPKDHPSGA